MDDDQAADIESIDPLTHESTFDQLWQDIAIGTAILALIFLADWLEFSKWAKTDAYFDWLMPILTGTSPDGRLKERFLFVDIDDRTLEELRDPLIMPRGEIRTLLEFAADERSGAKLVILDVALSHRSDELTGRNDADPEASWSCTQGQEGDLLDDPDRRLWQFFCDDREGGPPILLARAFDLGDQAGNGAVPGAPERSFLDKHPYITPYTWFSDLTEATPAPVYWASPLFLRDGDLVVRHWQLWSQFCREDEDGASVEKNRVGILPSIQLLSRVLLSKGEGTSAAEPVDDLRNQFAGWTETYPENDGDCSKNLVPADTEPSSLRAAGYDGDVNATLPAVDLRRERFGERLLYTLPWGSSKIELPPDRLKVLPAWRVREEMSEKASDENEVDRSILEDRIVIIGSSSAQARDIHGTPLGVMPGGVVLMNAIQSLAAYGTIREPNRWIKLLAAASVVVTVIMLFFFLNFRLAALLSIAAIFVAGLLIMKFGLKYGYWLDLALPAAAILLFQKLVAPIGALRKINEVGFPRILLHQRFYR